MNLSNAASSPKRYWRGTDTDTDTWFIVKTTDPYARRELGGERWGILAGNEIPET